MFLFRKEHLANIDSYKARIKEAEESVTRISLNMVDLKEQNKQR